MASSHPTSHCIDNLIPKEDTRKRSKKLPKNKSPGNKKILP